MSKPRNKTNRRRLHYMGVLAAAGLLSVGGAGPDMALAAAGQYGNNTTIDNNLDVVDGADIVGEVVSWDAASADTIAGPLNYKENATVTITTGTEANTNGITVQDGKSAVLTNSANAAIKSTGAIATGTGNLTVNIGTGSFSNTGQTMSGTVTLNNATASATNAGNLAGVLLTLSGDATIEGMSAGSNTIAGSGTVTNDAALTGGALTLSSGIDVTGKGAISGNTSVTANAGASFSTTGGVTGGTVSLTNNNASADDFKVGTVSGGANVTAQNVTIDGLNGGNLKSNGSNVLTGTVGNAGDNKIDGSGGAGDTVILDDTVFAAGSNTFVGSDDAVILDNSAGTASIVGGTEANKTKIELGDGSVADLSGVNINTKDRYVTLVNDANNAVDDFKIGTVSNGATLTAQNVTIGGLNSGNIVVEENDVLTGNISGAGNTIYGLTGNPDVLTLGDSTKGATFTAGSETAIGNGTKGLTVKNDTANVAVIQGGVDVNNQTKISTDKHSIANLQDTNITGGFVTLTNENNDNADAFKIGTVSGGATLTAKNVLINGLDGGDIVVDEKDVLTGTVKGDSSIQGNNDVNTDTLTLRSAQIGQGGANDSTLTIGGLDANVNVVDDATKASSIVGATAGNSTDIVLEDGSSANLANTGLTGYVSLTNNNASADAFKVGTVSGGAYLTAKNVTIGGLNNSNIVVDEKDVLTGTIQGTSNVRGNGDATPDTLTLANATIGEGTMFNIGGTGSTQALKVTDGGLAGNQIKGSPAGTQINVADGSLVDLAKTTVANGAVALNNNNTGATNDQLVVGQATGSSVTAKYATVGGLDNSTLISDTSSRLNGPVTGTSSIQAKNGGDFVDISGVVIGAANGPTDLSIGGNGNALDFKGTLAEATVPASILGASGIDSTKVTLKAGAGAIDWTGVTIGSGQINLINQNQVTPDVNDFKIGTVNNAGTILTANAINVAGMSAGQTILQNGSVLGSLSGGKATVDGDTNSTIGQVTGSSTIEGKTGATDVATLTGGIGSASQDVTLNIGGPAGSGTAVTLNGTAGQAIGSASQTTNVNVTNGSVANLAGLDVSGSTNLSSDGTGSQAHFGNVANGTITAKASNSGTLDVKNIGEAGKTTTLKVDGAITQAAGGIVIGDATNKTTITGATNAAGNKLTLNDVDAATNGATEFTIAADGTTSQVAVGVDNITGSLSTAGTIYEAIVNVAGAGATLTNAAGNGYATLAGTVAANISNAANVAFNNNSLATDDFTLAATTGGKVALNNDISGGVVTASADGTGSTSTLKNVSNGTVSNTASGGGKAVTGNVSGGTVTSGAAGDGSSSTVGAISGTGTTVNVAATNKGASTGGPVSSGGSLTISAAGDGSTARVLADGGTPAKSVDNATLTATASNKGELTIDGAINQAISSSLTADGGTINLNGDITNTGNTAANTGGLGVTAQNKGTITGKNIDNSVVNATATGDSSISFVDVKNKSILNADAKDTGGDKSVISVVNVDDSTVNAKGNVIISGEISNVNIGVDTNTLTDAVVLNTGTYTGDNFVYAITGATVPDPSAVPNQHNVIVDGATIGKSDKDTVMTFGSTALPATGTNVGAVYVTDDDGTSTYGGSIVGGDASHSTTINVVGKTIFNLANTDINGGNVTLNNLGSGTADDMVVGKATNNAVVTAQKATVSGLESATLISDGSSVLTGAITGANNVIKALKAGDAVLLDGLTIGQTAGATNLTIGGDGKAINVALNGTTTIEGASGANSTNIALATGAGPLDLSTVNLASGGNVSLDNQTGVTDNFKIGTVSNGTVLTAKAMNVGGLAGGTLVVDGTQNKLNGTVTKGGNAIYGKTNTGDDSLTVDTNLTIGDSTGAGTSLVVGSKDTKVTVKDAAGGTNIVGATDTNAVTSIKAVEGSTVDFDNSNLAGGNFEIGTDGQAGSQMNVGNLGDSSNTATSVAVDGKATAKTVVGTGATLKGSDANGDNLLILANGVSATANKGATGLNIDGTGSTIAVRTDTLTGDDSNQLTVNINGKGASLAGIADDTATDLSGTVTVNAKLGGTASFGDISQATDKIALNATNLNSLIEAGNVSGGAQVTAVTSDSGVITFKDVTGTGTKLTATADTKGEIRINDITNKAVVTATGLGTKTDGGWVYVHDVDDATLISIGNVKITGTVSNLGLAVDNNTLDNATLMSANYSGNNWVFAVDLDKGQIPDTTANPLEHNVIVDGASFGKAGNNTEITFGAMVHPSDPSYDASKMGAVNVTDAGAATPSTIVGGGEGYSTVVNVVGDTIFNLGNTNITGGNVALNNQGSGGTDKMVVGKATGNAVVTSTKATVSGLESATLISDGGKLTGAVIGANNVIKALNDGDAVLLDGLTIGQMAGTTDLIIGGDGKAIDVALNSTTIQGASGTDSTNIALAAGAGQLDWSTLNLAGGGNIALDNRTGTTDNFKIGTVSNGTVLTAKAMNVGGLAGGTLVVDGTQNKLGGTVTKTGNAIYGQSKTGDDILTVDNSLSIGDGNDTSLVVGKDGTRVTVKDNAGGTNIVGGDGTAVTSIKAVEGSTVDFSRTNLAGGNFEIGTDSGQGSQMKVGDLGDNSSNKTNVSVDGQATAQTVIGTNTTIKGSDADGKNQLTLAGGVDSGKNGNNANTTLNIDGTGSTIAVKTDSVQGGDGKSMTINVDGAGASLAGTSTGSGTDLSGTVVANATKGGSATFGNFDGADDDITLNADGNYSLINTGNLSGGAQVEANASNSGKINLGNVSGQGTELIAEATTKGQITIQNVSNKATVAARTDEDKDSTITIANVNDATLIQDGNVTVTGEIIDASHGINVGGVETIDSKAQLTGNQFYFAVDSSKATYPNPDPSADPTQHNVVLSGGTIGGSSVRPTEVTFGANVHPDANGNVPLANQGPVQVTDNAASTIDGSGRGTTINLVGNTIFNLDQTTVKYGTTTFNINNTSHEATIGGQVGGANEAERGTIVASTTNTSPSATGEAATLVNKGNVVGYTTIENGSANDNTIEYVIEGSLGDSNVTTNFTVEDGIRVTRTGTSQVKGDVTLVSNTSENVNLGQLQNNSTLTYSAAGTGDGAVNLAGTGADIVASIINNGAGSLTVDSTGNGSNLTYSGTGNTRIKTTGAGSSTTVEDGTVTLAGAGAGSKLVVGKGTANLNGAGFSNLSQVAMNSTTGTSTLANTGAAATLGSGLDATVGNSNVVVRTGNGLTLGGDVNLTGNGTGAFQVAGNAINMNNHDLKVKGATNFEFGNQASGFSNLGNLDTAEGSSVAFVGKQGYLDAKTANVNGATTYNADLNVGGSGTANNTIYADTVNVKRGSGGLKVAGALSLVNGGALKVGDTVEVGGALSLAGNGLAFDAGASYAQGGTAITAGGNVSIAAGTVFSVDNLNQAQSASFQVVDGANVGTREWANLSYAGGNRYDGTGAYFYDWTSGNFDYVSLGDAKASVGRAPGFAKSYVNALMHKNARLATTEASNEEITMAMGNTLNAALMMNNNPLDPIMKNLNTLHVQQENLLAKSAGECEVYGLWATPNFSYRSIDGNYGRGYGDVDIKSYGLTLGGDAWVNDQIRVGGFFALNNAELRGDFQRIDGNDYQLGVFAQALLDQGFMVNVGLAYGWQDYDASRRVYVANEPRASQRIKSNFDGNTFAFTAEVNKTFALDYGMFARPSVSYTYLGTDLDSYREKSSLAGNDPWNLAQRVGDTSFDLHLFRIGTDIGWASENAAVIGRIYYVGNAGDKQPSNTARFVQAPIGTPAFKIYGAEYDTNMANLGLTVKVAPTVNTQVAIDYDALLGSNSSTHNVNLSVKYEW